MALDNMSTIIHNSKVRDRQAENHAAMSATLDKLQRICSEALGHEDAIAVTVKIPIRYGKLCDPTLAIERR